MYEYFYMRSSKKWKNNIPNAPIQITEPKKSSVSFAILIILKSNTTYNITIKLDITNPISSDITEYIKSEDLTGR